MCLQEAIGQFSLYQPFRKIFFIKSILLLLIFFNFEPVYSQIVSENRKQELLYILKQDCGSCHGMTLKGGLGPSLLANTLKDKRVEDLAQTILKGRSLLGMPPWEAFVNSNEALWLAHYLKNGK